MTLAIKPVARSAFTLIEMTLTLFLLSSLFIIGSHYYQPQTTELSEKLAVRQFKRAWDSGVNYSATHKTNIYVEFNANQNTVDFYTFAHGWGRQIQFPDTIKFGSNAKSFNSIADGKTKKPVTIVFTNQRGHDYKVTAQLYWGRLNVKDDS